MTTPYPLVRRIETTPPALRATVVTALSEPGVRFGHLTGRVTAEGATVLEALLLHTGDGSCTVVSAPLPAGQREYPALSHAAPAAHRAERGLHDAFGVRPTGARHLRSLVLHDDAWGVEFAPLAPDRRGNREPYAFREIEGDGVHEIPVGPIHAGIIEPGHFRFSCVGEVIAYLEIRLGYQHRGVEEHLQRLPWQRTRFVAESASSDTAIGNALAHSIALERLLGIEAPARAQALRTLALEVERVANHAGDLGALAGDIGYSPCASLLPPLRGATLALAQLLSGNRRQRYYVRPGGVARDLPDQRRAAFREGLRELTRRLRAYVPLLLGNPGVLARMERTGRLAPSLARDFGLVGPAGRASGVAYDARRAFAHGLYPALAPTPALEETGDVLARARVRASELWASLELLAGLIDDLPQGPVCEECEGLSLPAESVGVGIVEAWRGEMIHWITTDAAGGISRYAIKDPSLNNWTGLAIAARGNLVADFPLCNKSFNLSYCGNDL